MNSQLPMETEPETKNGTQCVPFSLGGDPLAGSTDGEGDQKVVYPTFWDPAFLLPEESLKPPPGIPRGGYLESWYQRRLLAGVAPYTVLKTIYDELLHAGTECKARWDKSKLTGTLAPGSRDGEGTSVRFGVRIFTDTVTDTTTNPSSVPGYILEFRRKNDGGLAFNLMYRRLTAHLEDLKLVASAPMDEVVPGDPPALSPWLELGAETA